MKKLMLVFLIAFCGNVFLFSQDHQPVSGKTYKIDGVSAEELYARAFNWTYDFFSNDGHVMISKELKKDLFKIDGSVLIPSVRESVTFEMEFSFSGNQCTLTLNNLSGRSAPVIHYFEQILDRMQVVLATDLSEEARVRLSQIMK